MAIPLTCVIAMDGTRMCLRQQIESYLRKADAATSKQQADQFRLLAIACQQILLEIENSRRGHDGQAA